jgi:serine/tyrosine/threonine adenylyltransferase
MKLGFQHSYHTLPERFYAPVKPTPVSDPKLVALNLPLALELGLDPGSLEPHAAALFSGNDLPEDAEPLAMAYAGHQFGSFVPRLGDGRAILLGELLGKDGRLHDLQLKGAGRTPFSRSGDGRAVVGPMLREYLISEAMHALGVPTTRSLAVVTTGERVYREEAQPGAVLTRVAASHIRVGTFQYFAARGDQEGITALLDYVIARHYPSVREASLPALALLTEVSRRQAALIAQWMLVGFIHGVMNTDNMALSGETIDYGPCAFMDEYDPDTVFSSIDVRGRYAYGNQPAIAQWNLARLGETLLPLINPDTLRAVELATPVIESFIAQVEEAVLDGMRRKLGLSQAEDDDNALFRDLLGVMQEATADFTLTFRRLSALAAGTENREILPATPGFDRWLAAWQARLTRDPQTPEQRGTLMRAASPAFIPRNHRVDAALKAAETGDYAPFQKLVAILQRPYEDQPGNQEYMQPPQDSERVLHTFCGT